MMHNWFLVWTAGFIVFLSAQLASAQLAPLPIFSLATSAASFPLRYGAFSYEFGGLFFIAGGQAYGGGAQNDIWYSADGGTSWTASTSYYFPPGGIWFGGVQVINNIVVLIDGHNFGGSYNNVFISTDGITFTNTVRQYSGGNLALTLVSPILSGSTGPTELLVYHSGNSPLSNTVYLSTDGLSWSAPITGPWSPRFSTQLAGIEAGSRVVLTGGWDGTSFFNDVWLSDLITSLTVISHWTQLTSSTKFSPRAQHILFNVYDVLYLLSGIEAPYPSYLNDVWVSIDSGNNWKQVSLAESFAARTFATVSVLGRRVLFGTGSNAVAAYNDIWVGFVGNPSPY